MAPNKNSKTPKRTTSVKHKSNKSVWLALAIIVIVIVGFAAYEVMANQPAATSIPPTKVLLQTTAGNITIDLRTDKPITSGNFINLVKDGKYDGTTFYRTVAGFMIQGGKVSGSVSAIKDEIGSNNHNVNYTIAMAKTSQPNSATSEFFINAADNSKIVYPDGSTFDGTYTVFGTVISGQDVVDKIANAPATANPNNPSEISNPVNPVTITKATIVP